MLFLLPFQHEMIHAYLFVTDNNKVSTMTDNNKVSTMTDNNKVSTSH